MKLESIGITNFRCFESLSLKLETDVNMIVGANGAGKTAILDAIAVALFDVVAANSGRSTQARKRQNASLKPTDIYVQPGSGQTAERRRDFVHISASATDLHPAKSIGLFPDDADLQRIEWQNRIIYTPPSNFQYPASESQDLGQLYSYMRSLWETFREVPNALDPLPAVAYYRSDRRLKGMPAIGDVFSANFERDAAFEGALDAGADYQAMCRWLYLVENEELRHQRKAPSEPGTILPTMHDALRQLIQGLEDFGFEGMPPRLMVTTTTNGNRNDLLLDQLSDGYRGLIGICLDFARRLALANPNSKAPLEEPGILLIDEIELHLHPGWQQTIVPKLRRVFTDTQVIATTHSPQVLTSIDSKSIRILSDFTLHAAPTGTFGAESKTLLEQVLGVASRPPEDLVQPVRQLNDLYRLINEQKYEDAQSLLRDLLGSGYAADPAVIEAEMAIENRLWERDSQT